jgi:hypothetical protein
MVGDDGRGMVWPDEVPPEISKQRGPEPAEKAAKPEPKRPRAGAQAGVPRRGDGQRSVEGVREDKPAPAASGGKGKKKKKRAPDGDEPRPQLVAVPPAEPSEPGPRPVARPVPSREDRPRAVPPARKSPSKPKRELPPYLRVVK